MCSCDMLMSISGMRLWTFVSSCQRKTDTLTSWKKRFDLYEPLHQHLDRVLPLWHDGFSASVVILFVALLEVNVDHTYGLIWHSCIPYLISISMSMFVSGVHIYKTFSFLAWFLLVFCCFLSSYVLYLHCVLLVKYTLSSTLKFGGTFC